MTTIRFIGGPDDANFTGPKNGCLMNLDNPASELNWPFLKGGDFWKAAWLLNDERTTYVFSGCVFSSCGPSVMA